MNSRKPVRIALAGRPNVGKSTLLNLLAAKKIGIVSRKAGTTFFPISEEIGQMDFKLEITDTPGILARSNSPVSKESNSLLNEVIADADSILLLFDARFFYHEDDFALKKVLSFKKPTLLILNKIDLVDRYESLLPQMQLLAEKWPGQPVLPISARRRSSIRLILRALLKTIPAGDQGSFSSDDKLDWQEKIGPIKNLHHLIHDSIREQIMKFLHYELPYHLRIENIEAKVVHGIWEIKSDLIVTRESQRKIVLGAKGRLLYLIKERAMNRISRILKEDLRMEIKVRVDRRVNQSNSLPE